MTPTIGHNSGRIDEPGKSWRKHVWTKARKDLLPTLPIEVVRLRVKRATALGLPYKTYAGIRASTGHDLIGFLFSSNALNLLRPGQDIPADRAAVLQAIAAKRIGVAHHPLRPVDLAAQQGLDAAHAAPQFTQSWADMRDRMIAIVQTTRQPADRFVMIGDTSFEAEWAEAARMAGYLPAARYFGDHRAT